MANELASAPISLFERGQFRGHGVRLYVPHVSANVDFHRPYYQFGPLSKIKEGYIDDSDLISMLSVNPATAEDANGAINYSFSYEKNHPFCFNFSDVPANRLWANFDALFKTN